MSSINSCYILLGSNINPESNMREAIGHINNNFDVTAISKIYKTKPIKKKNVNSYLNAVVEVQSNLQPTEIKYDCLRKIEDQMGRVRTDDKFDPRVIDLDLILMDDMIYDDGDIILPDPEILEYGHIAIPLSDLIPEKIHPVVNKPYKLIAKQLAAKADLVVVEI